MFIMKKILYITSSIPDSGPTQQLFNIIQGLDRKRFEPVLVTLAGQLDGDRSLIFETLDMEMLRLSLGGLRGIFPGNTIKQLIKKIKPDLVHSQGFRPDILCMMLGLKVPRVLTIRNAPFSDYPSKFGRVIGYLMAVVHVIAIKSCDHPVACSESLKGVFARYNIQAKAIRNGVNFGSAFKREESLANTSAKTLFVTAGSLIPRKNIELMSRVFTSKMLVDNSDLVVLGDGFLRSACEKYAADNVIFLGHVDDTFKHLCLADFYISLSLSEGMPNGVLEALSVGVPCVLSNIEPHREIAAAMPNCVFLVDHLSSEERVASQILEVLSQFYKFERESIKAKAQDLFDSKVNSKSYQAIYLELTEVWYE